MFSRLGYPVSMTADNGRQFMNGEIERQHRDIVKRLKISKIENKDMKEALYEYLMLYNSTPHSVTGKTPSELFFRRQNRDKIPMLRDINDRENDSEARDRDKWQKEKGKEYGDLKRRAKDSDIIEGDKVYVKEMEKTNKLSSNFNPTPHIVENAVGGDITVRNEETGQKLRTNIIHLKKVECQWKTVTPDEAQPGDES